MEYYHPITHFLMHPSPPPLHHLFTLPPPTSHLILLIGLPGSGKSSVAARLLQECPERRLISTDRIRAELFGDEAVQGPWLKVWNEVEKQFRQTVQQIGAGMVQEAIYDATNVVRKQRRDAIALARISGFTCITGLWLNPPLWVCLERNEKRDRQVPVSVILDMHRSLISAPPTLEEGIDRLIEVTRG
ncbi:AAA family ATPase [Leptothermofonsia sp. ETS-13]|uniref:AAA family ATPase n=1 Tax=Leptothermofonsia sp. ETS-13 TaxID=3035696 RepID=UPI003BA310E8